VTRTVRVRPEEPGTWLVTSTNFSYRDRRGLGQRVEGFAVELVVAQAEAPPEPAAPELVLTLATEHLPHRAWQALRGRVENVGGSATHETTVTISGQLRTDNRNSRVELGRIPPRKYAEFTHHVRADDRGDVPVYLDAEFTDGWGRPGRVERTFTVSVGEDVPPPVLRDEVRVLYLAASPSDVDRTRWEEGFREIEDACLRSRNAARFQLENRFAVRHKDIGQALIDTAPHVVQFSGHGLDGGLYVESVLGRRQAIAAEGVVELFRVNAGSVHCVILGACHSMPLARDLARHIEYVVGMDGEIDSRSMINFSIGFYQVLAAGGPVEKAFENGLAYIAMQSHKNEDRLVPRLFTKGHSGT
jgi:hypothetical protein